MGFGEMKQGQALSIGARAKFPGYFQTGPGRKGGHKAALKTGGKLERK